MREHRGRSVGIAVLATALIAAIALSLSSVQSASASPAAPVLEFVAPSFPVSFSAEGGEVTAVLADFDTVVHCESSSGSGELTGPRTALSHYAFTGCETQGGADGGEACESEGAAPHEIRSGRIEAELVFINQLTLQVGMLLAPHGGVYLSFKCAGEPVKAIGPFLSPVGPINEIGTSFTATLTRSGATQVPDHYEGPGGESSAAIPTGERGTEPPGTTGVELLFHIHTAVPIQVKAETAAEVELRLNDELTALAAKKHQEEEARAAAEKKAQEEAAERRQREELALAQERAQKRAKALRQCRKLKIRPARTSCEVRVKKKYRSRNPVATASA